jgi:uncharacterized protein
MKLLKGIEAVDLCLLVDDTLIIGDVHIGYEEELNKKGILIPRISFNEVIQRLSRIFKKVFVNKIILLGDLKHEFGTISETEWRNTLRLVDFLSKHCNDLILLKGNHDTILEPILSKRDLIVKDYVVLDGILFCHGDRLVSELGVKEKFNTIIIGHEHPAVTIGTVTRKERYKCFLVGKFEKKNLVVVPSFNLLTEGTNVLRDRLLSPFLKDISKFNVYIVGDEVLDFGLVKSLRN